MEKGYEDIVTCLQWLRETPQCNGLVTTIGFGVGANLSLFVWPMVRCRVICLL